MSPLPTQLKSSNPPPFPLALPYRYNVPSSLAATSADPTPDRFGTVTVVWFSTAVNCSVLLSWTTVLLTLVEAPRTIWFALVDAAPIPMAVAP